MNIPDAQIPDEMLSAFLDGELTPDEEEHVNAALQQNESLRTLLAELKQIRVEIQSLPRHALSEDFAARVVKSCVTDTSATEHAVSPPPATQSTSRMRLIAGIAATAAAILIGLYAIGPGGSIVPVARVEPEDDDMGIATSATDRDASVAEMIHDTQTQPKADSFTPDAPVADLDEAVADRTEALAAFKDDSAIRRQQTRAGADEYSLRRNYQLDEEALPSNVASSIDAVVRVLPAPRGLSLSKVVENNRMKPLEHIKSKATEPNHEFWKMTQAVSSNAEAMVLEGTRAEIEQTFRELNAKTEVIGLFGDATDLAAMGLPATARRAKFARSPGLFPPATASNASALVGGAEGQTLSQHALGAEADQPDELASAEYKQVEELSDRGIRKKELTTAASADTSVESTTRRYRILLIVESTESAAEQPTP